MTIANILTLALSLAVSVAGVAASWGAIGARLRSLEARLKQTERDARESAKGQGFRLGDLGERLAVVEDRAGVGRPRRSTRGLAVPEPTGGSDDSA